MTESKKIDAKFYDGDGDYVTVRTQDEILGAYVDTNGGGAYVAPADAPAVALAILEAAGHDAVTGERTTYMTARAVRNLRESVRMKAAREAREADLAAEAKARADREAADAADLEALRREALDLHNAGRASLGLSKLEKLVDETYWLAVARTARAQGSAPAPRIKPTWEIVERHTTRNQFLVVNHETRRVWPCGSRPDAERVLARVLQDPSRGWSRDLDDDDLVDTVVPRPALFPVVSGYRNGKHEYGVLDHANNRVAPFGTLSGAQSGARQIPANPEGWSWKPAAEYASLSEVVL